MTESEVEQFRQRLIGLQSELQSLGDSLEESGKTVELDQTRVGRLSRIDAMQGQQMALEVGRRRKQKLIDIAAALRRMEAGEYGVCLECDEEIDIRRLHADPANTHCISCAE